MSCAVYIGWDIREVLAYKVAKYSLAKFTKQYWEKPLIQDDLRKQGYYWREKDERASTDFSLTRFLVPYMNRYKGWALFADCDVIFLSDVKELFDGADPKYALYCVKHDYTPKEGNKMFIQTNSVYPKKNWSSVMLFNCAHPSNKALNLLTVNEESPSYLHQMKWLKEEEIGSLDKEWNFLVGEYEDPPSLPKIAHLTLGTPNLKTRPESCKNEMFDKLWFQYRNEMLAQS